eukprot:5614051-Prymnesium_polylepis.2
MCGQHVWPACVAGMWRCAPGGAAHVAACTKRRAPSGAQQAACSRRRAPHLLEARREARSHGRSVDEAVVAESVEAREVELHLALRDKPHAQRRRAARGRAARCRRGAAPSKQGTVHRDGVASVTAARDSRAASCVYVCLNCDVSRETVAQRRACVCA